MTRATETARQAIIEAACEWLIALHDEGVSAGDRAKFADWLTESPVHVHEYLLAEGTWSLVGQVLCDLEWPGHGDSGQSAGDTVVRLRNVIRVDTCRRASRPVSENRRD